MDKVTRYHFSRSQEGMVEAAEGNYVRWEDYERLHEILTIPNIVSDTTSSAMILRTLREHEAGLPVNAQDLINALMWRVANQRREIARLHGKGVHSAQGQSE